MYPSLVAVKFSFSSPFFFFFLLLLSVVLISVKYLQKVLSRDKDD